MPRCDELRGVGAGRPPQEEDLPCAEAPADVMVSVLRQLVRLRPPLPCLQLVLGTRGLLEVTVSTTG